MFYVDHSTKSTQWEDPRTTKISSGPAIEYSRDYKIKYESFKANLPKPAVSDTQDPAPVLIKITDSALIYLDTLSKLVVFL